ncbi:hypothetical protein F8M41_011589 [Gigaspora margarita]|uniref:Uncharacterized protein n=1 Tax=Gigaspora margarita TaxID=4874 RepID=A0A8H3WZ84_GIGMA|nr:hypothetical protein F8M41_011589 [Gigaspora margarita]
MVKILNKIWPTRNGSDKNVAYAIAVAQTILNPKYDKITMSDTAIKYKIAKNLNILKHNTGFLLSSSKDETGSIEKDNEKSNNVKKEPVRKPKNILKKLKNSKEEWEDQEELLEDPKEAEKKPEANYFYNVEKELVRKNKNISKKFSKIYKRPRKELPEDPKEAENKPEDNNSTFSIASSSSSLDDNDDSEKETNKNDK